jgi:hypothetical protein
MKKPHRSNGSLPLQFAAAYRRVVRHSKIGRSMSALTPKADIAGRQLDVRFVPKADIRHCGRD